MIDAKAFYHEDTHTLCYVVWDTKSLDAVVIDPVLDYNPETEETGTGFLDQILDFKNTKRLRIHYVLETHVHADHLTGSFALKRRSPSLKTAIHKNIVIAQHQFGGPDFIKNGSQFDRLIEDGDILDAGSMRIEAIHTPGHTPVCTSFSVSDMLFTGDAIFMPDFGTGRCDFPNGSAEQLYDSIQKIYALPDSTRIFVGHDYQPGGRELAFETSVHAQKKGNIHISAETTKEEFVKFRTERDAGLEEPKLLKKSIEFNIAAGREA